ncbi:helix-turn-helix transcriptional regulator [Vibrio sp. CAU 1672]|uniref:helix-turn-helix transcriptional regulator n=1 Tax=Vibrio sp. CAU 1672 TaxID=3032594 RepID=UPI0023DA3A15|nr:helix-turn-helix transcriptional regulator [Vibrio sp. CAU 1672]MDF2154554.1 helix-turn-helix transcriptional regulator [Vibrio sp. CAU 1672]
MIKIKAMPDAVHLVFDGTNTLPSWLWHLLQAVHFRLCQYQNNEKGQWRLRLPGKAAKHETVDSTLCILPGPKAQLEINLNLLSKPFPNKVAPPQELINLLSSMLLTDITPAATLSERTKQMIARKLPEVLSLNELAQGLNLSTRRLQQRLKSEETSYSTLIAEIRHSLALEKLAQPSYSICRIAHDLGFTEAASFHRAFRKAQGCTPGQYRDQIQTKVCEQNIVPVRLYAAENRLNHEHRNYHPKIAKVWIAVHDISFQKEVIVECEDLDGIWRNYSACFERWLAPGRELWSTTNIPVFDPMNFRISYRVAGVTYEDNNNEKGYHLSHHNRFLLGEARLFCMSLQHIHYQDRNMVSGQILTDKKGGDMLKVQIGPSTYSAHLREQYNTGVLEWHFCLPVEEPNSPISFSHHFDNGVFHDDNNGEFYWPYN